ncbi:MAG: hypothetical protein N3C63_09880 [Rhodocyclaceae bacterium]|nr:hypothetical protein [Rhodocyclaceae bacterium]
MLAAATLDRIFSSRFHIRALGAIPEAATGWLRFGITALPKTAPPCASS